MQVLEAEFRAAQQQNHADHEAIKSELHEVNLRTQPKPFGWKSLSILFGVLVMVSAWVWQAARYPDRAEFNSARDKQEQRDNQLDKDLGDLRIEQVRIRGDVKAIRDGVKRSEDKLDKALDRRRIGGR